MKELMTLEQFMREHPEDIIQIMSPIGYVTISPGILLNELSAHAGVRGTEMPVSWEELKEQVVETCNYNQDDGNWYLLTDDPSQDRPVHAPEMGI